MNRGARREIPYYFAPGRKLFQIVVKIKGEPGSHGRILDLLETRAKLVGATSYSLQDGTTIVSGFAEALSNSETAANLHRLAVSSGVVLEAEVLEGVDGMLIDTFHTGLETGGEYLMLVRRNALTRMLDNVHRLLGTAGEVLLYQEGLAVGRANAEAFVKSLGGERVRRNLGYLRNNLAAQGWGRIETKEGPDEGGSTIVIRDCFECSSNKGKRMGCHFFRGYIAGNRSVTFREEFAVQEPRCTLRGDDACEFVAKSSAAGL